MSIQANEASLLSLLIEGVIFGEPIMSCIESGLMLLLGVFLMLFLVMTAVLHKRRQSNGHKQLALPLGALMLLVACAVCLPYGSPSFKR
jgi:hypothetical protein